MTNCKFILSFFIWTLLTVAACTTAPANHTGLTNLDTTYETTTQHLRSDRIPDSVFQMSHLRHLAITGQDCDIREVDKNGNDITQCWMIKEIPSQIKNLKELVTLDFPLNSITEIPNELAELKNLKRLSLTDNLGISDISNATKIKSLEYLNLYGCSLTQLPNNIGDLKNLKELGLAGNHFDKSEQVRIQQALPNCRTIF